MIPLISADDSRRIDHRAIAQDGCTPLSLMEHAVANSAKVIRSILGTGSHTVLVYCGAGNNGGDGFGVAAALADAYTVHVRWIGDPTRRSAETAEMVQRCTRVASIAPYSSEEVIDDVTVMIDALIGVGCTPPLSGPVIDVLCSARSISAIRISLDIPTGLAATTGEADVHAFMADHTVTMAAEKIGFWRNDGPRYVGRIHVADIGASASTIAASTTAWRLEGSDIRTILPRREQPSSKFSYGRVLVIAGSRSMRGAAALTAHAALVAGAGLVELVTTGLHPLIPREVITHEVAATPSGTIAPEARGVLQERIAAATCIAVGPGLGADETTIAFLAELLQNVPTTVPIILDADGLRCLPLITSGDHTMILTPHLGEFARLRGTDREALRGIVMEAAIMYAQERRCIVHAKDVPSITTNGSATILTVNGNPGMATAGAGDVLTGIIAALCAQGVPAFHAAALGAYLHALAGDRYAAVASMESLTASDLILALRDVIPQ